MAEAIERKHRYGTVRILPEDPVIAGSYVTRQLVYTAGSYGIENGGALIICWRFAADWGRPQTDDPGAPNYLSAKTSGRASLRLAYIFRGHSRPWFHTVRLEVFDGFIAPGEEIVITFGDTSQGSPGWQARTVAGQDDWLVLVDCLGARWLQALDDRPVIQVVPDKAARLTVTLPSDVECREQCWFLIRVEDRWGNVATDYRGSVSLKIVGQTGEALTPSEGLPASVTFGLAEQGVKRLQLLSFEKPGVYYVQARDEASGLFAVSNPVQVHSSKPVWRHYWGDLHGQSQEALGLGTIDEYFQFARDVAAVDFCSTQCNDIDVDDEAWQKICNASRRLNESGRFVTFLGYEWSGNTAGGGDRNVVFMTDNAEIQRSSILGLQGRVKQAVDIYPVSKLYELFAGRKDVLIIPHVGGRYANLIFHNADLEPLIKIYSCWGLFEWFLREALKRGLKVGFIAGSDDHSGRPGAAAPGTHAFSVRGGLTCVLAETLTREALFEALKARRCYATSGERILLDVTCNGAPMGSELILAGHPRFRVRVVGTAGLEFVKVWRFSRKDGELKPVYSFPMHEGAPLSNRFKITWGGLRQMGRDFRTNWDGRIIIKSGRILRVEPWGFDTPLEGIMEWDGQTVSWCSQTAGDSDGVLLDIEAVDEAILCFESRPCNVQIKISEVTAQPKTFRAGGIDQYVRIRRLPMLPFPLSVEFDWTDTACPGGEVSYYVKVVQEDGAVAYCSPFYLLVDR